MTKGQDIMPITAKRSHRCISLFAAIILMLFPTSLLEAQTPNPVLGSTLMSEDEALDIGEEFGLIVGEVDEELREYLGLERAEGVVVFEVIGGKPADLAGLQAKSLIKEIDSREIKNLKDFGTALKRALGTENFSLVTYQPSNLTDQGITGGIQFHFVRIEKT